MAAVILFTAASSFAGKPGYSRIMADTTKKTKPKVVYTCPMHTDILASKPGKCPKPGCGMTLVKKADSKTPGGKMKI